MALRKDLVLARMVETTRSNNMPRWAVAILLVVGVAAAGCGESKNSPSGVTNAAPVPSAPPSNVGTLLPTSPPVEPVDNSIVVTGPIIVEHQVDIVERSRG